MPPQPDPSPSPDPLPAQPVLSYATPDADGQLDWHDQAEEMIDRGASPAYLRRYFRTTTDAVRYFVKSMRRRFSAETAGDRCVVCGQPATAFWAVCTWEVRARVRTFEFNVSQSVITREVATCHAVCEACAVHWLVRPWMDRLLIAGHWARLATWLAIAAVVIIVLQSRALHEAVGTALLSFIIAMILLQLAAKISWYLRTPDAVIRLMPRSGVRLVRADLQPQRIAHASPPQPDAPPPD